VRHRFGIIVALMLAIACPDLAGVRKVSDPDLPPPGPAAASDSAALFVGVRTFPEDETLTEVQYAVDDAIDLAYAMSMARRPALVNPDRIVLALSGSPDKAESKRNLEVLKAAGAMVAQARHEDILKLLRRQANAVGKNGLLIVAFATHGMNDEGTQHLLTASSLLQDPETSVTETKVREIVSKARVPRSLILIDACRERLTSDIRTGTASPHSSAAQLMQELGQMRGQVILSAAVAGQYAYDDDTRRNGVFTAAVIDALQCAAASDENGFVTVEALSRYVEERVLTWIQKHRDPEATRATQVSFEGRSGLMPLSVCSSAARRERNGLGWSDVAERPYVP